MSYFTGCSKYHIFSFFRSSSFNLHEDYFALHCPMYQIVNRKYILLVFYIPIIFCTIKLSEQMNKQQKFIDSFSPFAIYYFHVILVERFIQPGDTFVLFWHLLIFHVLIMFCTPKAEEQMNKKEKSMSHRPFIPLVVYSQMKLDEKFKLSIDTRTFATLRTYTMLL